MLSYNITVKSFFFLVNIACFTNLQPRAFMFYDERKILCIRLLKNEIRVGMYTQDILNFFLLQ